MASESASIQFVKGILVRVMCVCTFVHVASAAAGEPLLIFSGISHLPPPTQLS
ncbi:MAG: hypothetical protein IID41_15135 [Planctomycetes bacterium]|nr:hypothetical protein [Planctomycetota bacterium]